MTRAHFDGIVARMLADRQYWDLVELGARVAEGAERLILQRRSGPSTLCTSPLRCFQMESAKPLPFATADARQREAADHAGLKWCGLPEAIAGPAKVVTRSYSYRTAGTAAAKRARTLAQWTGSIRLP